MRALRIAVLMAFALASGARAQSPKIFTTGNMLLVSCQHNGAAEKASDICEAYIQGVVDSFDTAATIDRNDRSRPAPAWCVGQDIMIGQIGDVVLQYLVAHPKDRDMPAAALIYLAMIAAFPCSAR
jgi:hypothetical protein